jgi:hypothetical protein
LLPVKVKGVRQGVRGFLKSTGPILSVAFRAIADATWVYPRVTRMSE